MIAAQLSLPISKSACNPDGFKGAHVSSVSFHFVRLDIVVVLVLIVVIESSTFIGVPP